MTHEDAELVGFAARFRPLDRCTRASTSTGVSFVKDGKNFGFSSSSCSISGALLSPPPENLQFTEREANFGSIS